MDTDTFAPSTNEARLGHRVADSASHAIHSTQALAQGVLDRMANSAVAARDQANPIIDRLADRADNATRRGIEAVRDTSAQVREQAARASEVTITYIRQEPLKAMLVAAAAGALLVVLAGWSSRSRSDR